MEQHPVPQNVTTFQFRLVGDMTIKQFGYLAGGIIVGYLCYKLPLPFFFTWPLAITSGLLGFGLAFVPVEERPMDVWIASFFKNVYSPTRWVWSREARSGSAGQKSEPKPVSQQGAPQPAIHRTTGANLASGAILSVHHATNPLDWLTSVFRGKSKPASPSLSPGFSFADALVKEAQKPAAPPPTQPSVPQTPVSAPTPPQTTHPSAHERVVELQTQLSESLQERERLEKELITIRQRMGAQTQTPMRQASVVLPAEPSTASVRIIAPGAASKAGLPKLTTFPNVVTGIIKDHYGNLLAGMLITVRDKDDIPLRALKTNKLGQFAASTPLPNSTYIVEIEDPRGGFIFDKIQIPLNGAVAPPIEVTAKSQKQVERDKLAREIFGNQQSEFTMTKPQ